MNRTIGRTIGIIAAMITLSACSSGSQTTPVQTVVPGALSTPTAVVTPQPTQPGAATSTVPIVTATSVGSSNNVAMMELGRQIFQDGMGTNGQLIGRTGGPSGGMMGGGMMMTTGCAACHGEQGQGGQTSQFVAPNITYRNLTDPQGMLEPDGSRGSTYTDAQIRRAIISGIGADGDSLDSTMPRWQMSETEANAVIVYLMTLP